MRSNKKLDECSATWYYIIVTNKYHSKNKNEKENKHMSARVVETTFKARETLRITTATNITPLKDVPDGKEFTYYGHVVQEIVNETTGETFNSVTVKVGDDEYIATRSEFFLRTLQEIIETINSFADDEDADEPIIIKIQHLKSKKGNSFATCSLA